MKNLTLTFMIVFIAGAISTNVLAISQTNNSEVAIINAYPGAVRDKLKADVKSQQEYRLRHEKSSYFS